MSKDKSMKDIVLSVSKKHPRLVAKLQRDRDWLWLEGDYKDFPTVRETLKELGFRFSRKGHELDNGDTCHWYHSCGVKSTAPRRKQHKVVTTVEPVESPNEANPDLFAKDVKSEFAAMFPGIA